MYPLLNKPLKPRIGVRVLISWWALALLLLPGCAPPIGVRQVTMREAYRQVEANALNQGVASASSQFVLHRYGLEEEYHKDPDKALRRLYEQVCKDDRRDLYYALSELSYLRAEKLRRSVKPGEPRRARDHYLASAVYAYYYLLEQGHGSTPSAFDRRFRVACDLYNHALAGGLSNLDQSEFQVRDEVRQLPFGSLEIKVDVSSFPWAVDSFDKFLPADRFAVRGTSVRVRDPGLGVPLIAVEKTPKVLPVTPRLPVTAFLELQGDPCSRSGAAIHGSLRLRSAFDQESIDVEGRLVPLESDSTAPLAHSLHNSALWDLSFKQFFSSREVVRTDTYPTQPRREGLIPVVFVHGTASSPVWWTEMWNTLRADPTLRKRLQFWVYTYNTGNPINISAARLRRSLTSLAAQLDPEGKDPSVRQMVVVGHSQGGLLTKMTAVDSGNLLWRTISLREVEELDLSADQRSAIKESMFFEPLPFVKRVVFISTPHRGSFRVRTWVQSLARMLVKLPTGFAQMTVSLMQADPEAKVPREWRGKAPTSIDGMSPSNPFLLALAEIPVTPPIQSHSIIAVKGDGEVQDGDDGVVKYTSAYQDYVKSTFVVRHPHSCQGHPLVIEEMRRILLEHLRENGPSPPRPAAAGTGE